jgi:hypothetical protein
MNEAQPPKQNKTGIIVLACAFALAAGASIYFALQSHHRGVELVRLQKQLEDTSKLDADLFQNTTAQLQATKAKLADAQARIAQMQPLAEKALRLPVATRLIRAPFGSGYDLRIQNHSFQVLELGITITPSVGESRSVRRVLDPRKLVLVNQLGPGDQIEIDAQGFDPLTVTVPSGQ